MKVAPVVGRHLAMHSSVLSQEAAFSATDDMSTALNLGSYTSRWLQKLVSSKSISGKLSSSNSQIKFYTNSFALSNLVMKLGKIGSEIRDLSQLIFQGKKSSYKNLPKKTLDLTAELSSAVATVSKTVLAADVLYAQHSEIPEQSRYALGETSTYAGLVGSFIGLVCCCWVMKDLHKKADVSDLKKRQIEVKKSNMNVKLITKISSVTSGILGCVSMAVSTTILPWLILVLNTVSFTITFSKRVRDAIVAPGVSIRQRALLSL